MFALGGREFGGVKISEFLSRGIPYLRQGFLDDKANKRAESRNISHISYISDNKEVESEGSGERGPDR